MRLTLRTLLSYLDDTLEPSQAKIIGAKAAESEQARELMERIKQVTRRRRLTTPATSGPGGIDPNTIAEYLDNEVSAEKSAEVEQICLASDVHLAEVAACHQILTLVLGEPALIPSSAKKRMYALVKGPESLAPGKSGTHSANPDLDLSSEIEPDQDETLRLGVPALRSKTDYRNLWILVGGASLAVCLLVVAFWQLVRNPASTGIEPKGDAIVQNDSKEVPKNAVANEEEKKTVQEVPKQKETGDNKQPPKKESEKKDTFPLVEVVPVKIEPIKELDYRPASLKQMPIGQFVAPDFKEPAVLLQAKPDKSGWVRLLRNNGSVFTARSLVSLSGSKSVVKLDSGVELLLWGNLPEVTLDPQLLESEVTVHVSEQLDADLTLQRGRLIIKNTKGDRDRRVRVRFDNPTLAEENYLDIVLQGLGAAIALERHCELDRDEPFFENPKDPARNGPTATLRCYAYAKTASVRFGQVSYTIDREQQPVLQWQSRKGVLGPPSQVFLPYWLKGMPPLKEEADQLARKNAVKAHETLAALLDNKLIDVALAEADATVQQAAQKEITMDKRISPETFALWRHVIRCSGSIDNVGAVFDEFAQEGTPLFIRGLCMQTLHSWVGLNRDNDYQLLAVLRKNYRKTESIKIMELFHKITSEDARNPVTYQRLIEGLNNDLLPIRALCHWHLFALVQAGHNIPYDPAAPRQVREAAVRAWTQLIPPGQLPPMGPPAKKGKSAAG